jgi:hypothetical protein
MFLAVLRIRDVYPGSDFFPCRIPDPNCLHPGSRIRIKEFKYFNPKKPKKWFLSSRKYDPGCSSRIPDPDADFLPISIPDPGVKKAPDPDPQHRFLGLPDPDPLVRGMDYDPDPSIIKQNSKKNLDSYCV